MFQSVMSAASPAVPATPPSPSPGAPNESRVARLLALVRKLIDYGRELAATLQRDPTTRPPEFRGTDIALILARIARGLHRAQALEQRLISNAARLDAPPRPRRAASKRTPPATQSDAPDSGSDPRLAPLPTPEQIAARVRRQPIGAVLADICRDLGIQPSHPLWRELRDLILRHGGSLANLLKEIIADTGRRVGEAWIAAGLPPGPLPLSPFPVGTGPPNPRA